MKKLFFIVFILVGATSASFAHAATILSQPDGATQAQTYSSPGRTMLITRIATSSFTGYSDASLSLSVKVDGTMPSLYFNLSDVSPLCGVDYGNTSQCGGGTWAYDTGTKILTYTNTSSTMVHRIKTEMQSFGINLGVADQHIYGTAASSSAVTQATYWYNSFANDTNIYAPYFSFDATGLANAIALTTPATSTQPAAWQVTLTIATSSAASGKLSVGFTNNTIGMESVNENAPISYTIGEHSVSVPMQQLYANTSYTAWAVWTMYNGGTLTSATTTFTTSNDASFLRNPWASYGNNTFTGTSTSNFSTSTYSDILATSPFSCPLSLFGYDVFDVCGAFTSMWRKLWDFNSPLLIAQITSLTEDMRHAFPLNWVQGIYNDFDISDPYTSSTRPDFTLDMHLPGDITASSTRLFSLASTTAWLNQDGGIDSFRAFWVVVEWLSFATYTIVRFRARLMITS